MKSIKLTALMIAMITMGAMAQPGDSTHTRVQNHYYSMLSLHRHGPVVAEGWIKYSSPDVEVEPWMLDEDYLSEPTVAVESWMLDETYLEQKVRVQGWMLDMKYLE